MNIITRLIFTLEILFVCGDDHSVSSTVEYDTSGLSLYAVPSCLVTRATNTPLHGSISLVLKDSFSDLEELTLHVTPSPHLGVPTFTPSLLENFKSNEDSASYTTFDVESPHNTLLHTQPIFKGASLSHDLNTTSVPTEGHKASVPEIPATFMSDALWDEITSPYQEKQDATPARNLSIGFSQSHLNIAILTPSFTYVSARLESLLPSNFNAKFTDSSQNMHSENNGGILLHPSSPSPVMFSSLLHTPANLMSTPSLRSSLFQDLSRKKSASLGTFGQSFLLSQTSNRTSASYKISEDELLTSVLSPLHIKDTASTYELLKLYGKSFIQVETNSLDFKLVGVSSFLNKASESGMTIKNLDTVYHKQELLSSREIKYYLTTHSQKTESENFITETVFSNLYFTEYSAVSFTQGQADKATPSVMWSKTEGDTYVSSSLRSPVGESATSISFDGPALLVTETIFSTVYEYLSEHMKSYTPVPGTKISKNVLSVTPTSANIPFLTFSSQHTGLFSTRAVTVNTSFPFPLNTTRSEKPSSLTLSSYLQTSANLIESYYLPASPSNPTSYASHSFGSSPGATPLSDVLIPLSPSSALTSTPSYGSSIVSPTILNPTFFMKSNQSPMSASNSAVLVQNSLVMTCLFCTGTTMMETPISTSPIISQTGTPTVICVNKSFVSHARTPSGTTAFMSNSRTLVLKPSPTNQTSFVIFTSSLLKSYLTPSHAQSNSLFHSSEFESFSWVLSESQLISSSSYFAVTTSQPLVFSDLLSSIRVSPSQGAPLNSSSPFLSDPISLMSVSPPLLLTSLSITPSSQAFVPSVPYSQTPAAISDSISLLVPTISSLLMTPNSLPDLYSYQSMNSISENYSSKILYFTSNFQSTLNIFTSVNSFSFSNRYLSSNIDSSLDLYSTSNFQSMQSLLSSFNVSKLPNFQPSSNSPLPLFSLTPPPELVSSISTFARPNSPVFSSSSLVFTGIVSSPAIFFNSTQSYGLGGASLVFPDYNTSQIYPSSPMLYPSVDFTALFTPSPILFSSLPLMSLSEFSSDINPSLSVPYLSSSIFSSSIIHPSAASLSQMFPSRVTFGDFPSTPPSTTLILPTLAPTPPLDSISASSILLSSKFEELASPSTISPSSTLVIPSIRVPTNSTTMDPNNSSSNTTVPPTKPEMTSLPNMDTSFATKPYWVMMELSVSQDEDIGSSTYRRDLEIKIAEAYSEGRKRRDEKEAEINQLLMKLNPDNDPYVLRRRRASTVGVNTAQIIDLSRTNVEPTVVEAVFYIAERLTSILASDCVIVFQELSLQELTLILDQIVVSEVKEYDVAPTAVPPPAVNVLAILLGIFIPLLILFLCSVCCCMVYIICIPKKRTERSMPPDTFKMLEFKQKFPYKPYTPTATPRPITRGDDFEDDGALNSSHTLGAGDNVFTERDPYFDEDERSFTLPDMIPTPVVQSPEVLKQSTGIQTLQEAKKQTRDVGLSMSHNSGILKKTQQNFDNARPSLSFTNTSSQSFESRPLPDLPPRYDDEYYKAQRDISRILEPEKYGGVHSRKRKKRRGISEALPSRDSLNNSSNSTSTWVEDDTVADEPIQETRKRIHDLIDEAFSLVSLKVTPKRNTIAPAPTSAADVTLAKSDDHVTSVPRDQHVLDLILQKKKDGGTQTDKHEEQPKVVVVPVDMQTPEGSITVWSPYNASDEISRLKPVINQENHMQNQAVPKYTNLNENHLEFERPQENANNDVGKMDQLKATSNLEYGSLEETEPYDLFPDKRLNTRKQLAMELERLHKHGSMNMHPLGDETFNSKLSENLKGVNTLNGHPRSHDHKIEPTTDYLVKIENDRRTRTSDYYDELNVTDVLRTGQSSGKLLDSIRAELQGYSRKGFEVPETADL